MSLHEHMIFEHGHLIQRHKTVREDIKKLEMYQEEQKLKEIERLKKEEAGGGRRWVPAGS